MRVRIIALSAALVALAGVTLREQSRSEVQDLWNRALEQLGMPLPSRRDAGLVLRDYYANRVAAGLMTPRSGAGEIIELARDLRDVFPDQQYVGDGLGITGLVGLYYSHDDVPTGADDVHDRIDAELFAECRRMVSEA